MTAWNEFAVPQSSYERPVPLVLVDPDDNPNYQVCFRSEWLPYILGSLQQLLLQTTWQSDDKETIQTQQGRARLLIQLFMEGCPVVLPDEGCLAYPMSASFVSYYPQNPYTQPGFVPDWYSIAPFVLVDSDLAATLTGTAIGDVVALNGAFPNPDAIAENGLSDIRLDLVGEGQVELHFVGLFAGALAAVTVDDDGLNTNFVDLNVDVIQLPPESYGETVHEVALTGAGAHHIDIRFTPVVDDSGIPLRYGGAMRSVVLCGFDALVGDTMFDVRQNEEEPCNLEKSTDGGETWSNFADLTLCPPTLRVDRGILQIFISGTWINVGTNGGTFDEKTDGAYDPPYPPEDTPAGQTGNCLAAENIVAFYSSSLTQMRAGLSAGLVSSAILSGIAGAVAGFITPVIFLAIGEALMSALFALGVAGVDDMLADDTLETLKCILSCHAEADGSFTAADYSAVYDEVTAAFSGAKRDIIKNWLDGFGPVGLSRQGRAADILTGDCDACGCVWCVEYDFTIAAYGDVWHSEPQDGSGWGGAWVSGVGWQNASTAFAMSAIMPAGMHITELWLDMTDDSAVYELHSTEAWNSSIITDELVAIGASPTTMDHTLSANGKLTVARATGHSPNVRRIRLKGDGARPPGGVNC